MAFCGKRFWIDGPDIERSPRKNGNNLESFKKNQEMIIAIWNKPKQWRNIAGVSRRWISHQGVAGKRSPRIRSQRCLYHFKADWQQSAFKRHERREMMRKYYLGMSQTEFFWIESNGLHASWTWVFLLFSSSHLLGSQNHITTKCKRAWSHCIDLIWMQCPMGGEI